MPLRIHALYLRELRWDFGHDLKVTVYIGAKHSNQQWQSRRPLRLYKVTEPLFHVKT